MSSLRETAGTLRPMRLVARTTIASVTAALVVVSTINATLGYGDIAIVYALGAPLGLAAWGFARAGNDEAAIVLLSCVLIAVITLTLFLSSMGVYDHAIIGYSGVLLINALVLDRRSFLAMAVLTMAAGIGVFTLEIAGFTHSRLSEPTGWSALVDFLLATAVIGGLGRYVAEVLYGSLGDARRGLVVDPATGLANRMHFTHLAGERLRGASPAPAFDALVLADLAGFRRVNQLVGHAAGDRILAEVARRVELLDGGALTGRVGDDEFALLASGLASEEEGRALAEQVRSRLTFEHAGVPVRVAVGVACRARGSAGIEGLFVSADESLAADLPKVGAGTATLT